MKLLTSYLAFLAVLGASPAQANDQERAYLEQLSKSMKNLEYLIRQAEASGNSFDEYSVDYDRLREEYKLLIKGVDEIIGAPRREPRDLTDRTPGEIKGDYLK